MSARKVLSSRGSPVSNCCHPEGAKRPRDLLSRHSSPTAPRGTRHSPGVPRPGRVSSQLHPRERTMRPITRFCASLSALAALIGCTSDSRRGAGSSGDVEQTFTPTQYTVEDFYQNTSFGGASFSPDRRKILVS